MDEKLNKLYIECIEELKKININMLDQKKVGNIDISISKRATKRYGCCIQENPDETSKYREGRKLKYRKYHLHHIIISKWVMSLNDEIIKNTIIHELLHCLPDCNNHGEKFKYYSKIINQELGYNISRLGNREEDLKKSNIPIEEEYYKYKIRCKSCNYIYYRKRLVKNFIKKYYCGICKGKLEII